MEVDVKDSSWQGSDAFRPVRRFHVNKLVPTKCKFKMLIAIYFHQNY